MSHTLQIQGVLKITEILKFFAKLKFLKKIRQIEGTSALPNQNVNKLSRIFLLNSKLFGTPCNIPFIMNDTTFNKQSEARIPIKQENKIKT